MSTIDSTTTQKGTAWGSADLFAYVNTVSTVVADGDVIQAVKIPAGVTVGNVIVRVVVQNDAGTTATATVGDGDDPNGWDAATDFAAAAGTETLGAAGTDAYAKTYGIQGYEGKTYTSEDTIDLVATIAGTAPTVGSVQVIALCTRQPMF